MPLPNPLFYNIVMPVVYVMCILTFILFAYDKHCATFRKFRIPEWVLVICSFAMGAFGGLCAMVLFNHKTAKPLFYIAVPLLLLLQILLMAAFLCFFI